MFLNCDQEAKKPVVVAVGDVLQPGYYVRFM